MDCKKEFFQNLLENSRKLFKISKIFAQFFKNLLKSHNIYSTFLQKLVFVSEKLIQNFSKILLTTSNSFKNFLKFIQHYQRISLKFFRWSQFFPTFVWRYIEIIQKYCHNSHKIQ